MQPHQKHFNALSQAVSQEGILSDTIAKVGRLFKSAPMDLSKNQDKLFNQYGTVISKELSVFLNKHFPGGRVPKHVRLVQGTVSGDQIVQKLTYKNQFDSSDPIAFVGRALSDAERQTAQFRAACEKASNRASQVDAGLKKAVGTLARNHKEGDGARKEAEALIEKASAQVRECVFEPFKAVPQAGYTWLGNWTTVVETKKDSRGRTFPQFVAKKGDNAKVSQTIPALTAPQIEAALKLIHRSLELDYFYTAGNWLDHSDGHEIHDQLEELELYDALIDAEYYDFGYFQSAWDFMDNNVPHGSWADQLVPMALLLWIDRSIVK